MPKRCDHKRRAVLGAISHFYEKESRYPTVCEIASLVGIPNTNANYYVTILMRDKLAAATPDLPRFIYPINTPQILQNRGRI